MACDSAGYVTHSDSYKKHVKGQKKGLTKKVGVLIYAMCHFRDISKLESMLYKLTK